TRGFRSSKKSRAEPVPPSGRVSTRSFLYAVSDMKPFVSQLGPKRGSGREWTRPERFSLDPRQFRELVERRRRGQRPFERRRAFAPGAVGCLLLPDEGLRHAEEEDQHAEGRDVGADRRDFVPVGE